MDDFLKSLSKYCTRKHLSLSAGAFVVEKDMAKEFAKPFYNSKKWLRCRDAYIAYRKSVDGGMCESCREVPGYIVHHVEELTPENIHDPDIALSFDNLKYDCHICHQKENVKEEVEGLIEYRFDDDGELIVLPPVNNYEK